MIFNIAATLNLLNTTLSTIDSVLKLSNKYKSNDGNKRILLEEIKHNLLICELVIKDKIKVNKVIKEFKTSAYRKLLSKNFDFNKLQKLKIEIPNYLNKSIDESWNGKSTSELIENLYDKIHELKTLISKSDNPRRRWNLRVMNINNKLILLTRHLSKD